MSSVRPLHCTHTCTHTCILEHDKAAIQVEIPKTHYLQTQNKHCNEWATITCDVVVLVSNHFLRGWLHFLHKTLIVGQHETITTATELCGVHCNMCLNTSWEGPKPHPLPGRVLNHTHLPHSNLTTVHILHQDMGYQTFVFWHIVLLHTHHNLAS